PTPCGVISGTFVPGPSKYLITICVLLVNVCFAQDKATDLQELKTDEGGDIQGGVVTLPNPLDPNKTGVNPTPQALIGKIINAALGIVGSLALVMFIYGGFMWMMAGGNTERVQKGKDTLVWTALGLVIIFSSYALVRFVLKAIGAE
ncbi:pilin, partial [Patescibacteria group bacterium]|nr:pilin [Patescibacteria group bacterium]